MFATVKIQTTSSRMRRLKERYQTGDVIIREYHQGDKKLKYPIREDDNFRQFRFNVLVDHKKAFTKNMFLSVKEFDTYVQNS